MDESEWCDVWGLGAVAAVLVLFLSNDLLRRGFCGSHHVCLQLPNPSAEPSKQVDWSSKARRSLTDDFGKSSEQENSKHTSGKLHTNPIPMQEEDADPESLQERLAKRKPLGDLSANVAPESQRLKGGHTCDKHVHAQRSPECLLHIQHTLKLVMADAAHR